MIGHDEFSATPIGEEQLVAWPRVAAVAAMVAFSLPTFITGLEVGIGLPPADALWALVVGSVIIVLIGGVMGAIGAHSRLSSYLLVRIAFGDRGAGLVNLAFAISLLGWFGININLFAGAVDRLAQTLLDWQINALWLSILASACMTVTTLVGFRAINILSVLLVPVLAVVTFLLVRSSLVTQPLGEILAVEKTATLTFGEGVSAVVGAIIVGAIILPDITRFARHWSGAVYTAIVAYIVVQITVMAAATLSGAVTGLDDILDILLHVNLGFGAFAIVIAGSWVLNSLNLYSAVLSTKATFPNLPTTWLTIGLGVAGVAAALMNILDQFITFLFYLSVVFVPVAGVIMVDFLLIRPARYHLDTLTGNRAFNRDGFIAWTVGAAYTLLAAEGLIPSATRIAAVDAIVLSGLVYAALTWRQRRPA